MLKNNLTAKQRVERANIELLGCRMTIAYSGVIMLGQYRIDPDVPTAYTDGVNCVYGEKFVQTLNDAQLRAVIMHETFHKTFQHTFLWIDLWEQHPIVANMAVDYVVNLVIKDLIDECNATTDLKGFLDFWVTPAPLLDEKFRGMDSGQVFRKIMKDAKGGRGEGGRGKGGRGKGGRGRGSGGDGDSLDRHGWEEAKALSKEEAAEMARDIDQAIRQGQLLAAKAKGSESRLLGELTQPKENWREQVSDFMTTYTDKGDVSTYRKVNRRWLQHDTYMPTTLSEAMGNIVIGVDLSGSVGQGEFMEFMSHVKLMCDTLKPQRLDLMYWDSNVNVHEVYFPENIDRLLSTTRPVGGGGTRPQCVADYIKVHKLRPDCIVILTDGYVDNWGHGWPCPILWGIVGGNRDVPSVGKVVYIES